MSSPDQKKITKYQLKKQADKAKKEAEEQAQIERNNTRRLHRIFLRETALEEFLEDYPIFDMCPKTHKDENIKKYFCCVYTLIKFDSLDDNSEYAMLKEMEESYEKMTEKMQTLLRKLTTEYGCLYTDDYKLEYV